MRKVTFAWIDHTSVDWLVLVAISSVIFVFAGALEVALMLNETVFVAVFQVTAGAAVTLAGFTFAGIAFLLGQLSDTLERLDRHWKSSGAKQIKSLVFKPFIFLTLTFAFSLGAVVMSAFPGASRRVIIAVAIGALAASASALGRNLWVLSRLAKA